MHVVLISAIFRLYLVRVALQVHLRGAAAPTAKGGGSKPKDLSKKAALLSGPPGIGKTSAAHIIARETG